MTILHIIQYRASLERTTQRLTTMEKICPNCMANWLRVTLVSINKKFGKKCKSYDSISSPDELEEQEFSITSLPATRSELPNTAAANQANYNKEIHNASEQNKQNESSSPKNTSERTIILGGFQLKLDPYDPYYEQISTSTAKLSQMLDQHIPNANAAVKLTDLGVNRPHFRVYQFPVSKGFQFVFEYELPCSYAFFQSVNRETLRVKDFNPNIEFFELLESVKPNLEVLGLSIKKILGLGMEPRRFNYLKYINSSHTETQHNKHWQICVSVPSKQNYGHMKLSSAKEAQIFSASHFEEQQWRDPDQEGGEEPNKTLKVYSFVKIDLHSIIKAQKFVNKGLKQVYNYVDRFYEHALNNYRGEDQMI